MTKNPAFFKILTSKGILKEEDIEKLNQKLKGDAFSILLRLCKGVRGTLAKKEDLGKWWADSIGYSFVSLKKTLFQPKIVQKLSEEFARKNKMILIYHFGEAVTAATWDPANQIILREAEKLVGAPLSPVFAFPDEIEDAIEVQYQSSHSLQGLIGKLSLDILSEDKKEISLKELKELAGNQGIVELARGIMLLAVKENASDIHIEPGEEKVRVRFRVDGVLRERLDLELNILLPLVSRLKIMANKNITERRRPQDGRISIPLSNHSIDFRFACIPTIHGEKIVIRVLGQLSRKSIPDLEELRFSSAHLKVVKKLIGVPNGVIFITGPTGSGKTTTLFSALKHLNKPGINIVTVEDPVEYKLEGITQIQVNPDVDLNFSTVLRAIVRQDPDVILVGEVRDLETAQIASQAALTGHLVMATMHTNNSLQAITRLIEIGVEPFLVAPAVIGVVAQRLVRKICEHCKEKYLLSIEQVEKMFIWDRKIKVFFYRGKGCDYCEQTGYSGRIGIYEIFVLNDKVREMVARSVSILDIQRYALEHGFKPLRYDGIKKTLQGLTTIEEVDRVTVEEAGFMDNFDAG